MQHPTPSLRPYQTRAIAAVNSKVASGTLRIVVVAPCGSGKTTIASKIISDAIAQGKRCLFVAHRKELVQQCSARLDQFGIRHDVFMAGYGDPVGEMACVASIDTIRARKGFPPSDVLIVDEAHRSRAKTYASLIEKFAGKVVLGLTATPVRTDKKELGEIYQDMVAVADVRELIDDGYLMEPVVFAPDTGIDLDDISIRGGDYEVGELAKAMGKAKITADIYDTWNRRGRGRQTLCFAVNVAHGEMLTQAFRERGVKVAFLCGATDAGEREETIDSFMAGKLEMIVNVSVLTEGFDHPPTGCVILARPTKSETVYMQACGRAMRPAPGKDDAIILDHAGCALEFGLPGDSRAYTIDDKDKAKGASPVKVCTECQNVVRASAKVCNFCGFVFPAGGDDDDDDAVVAAEGELTQLASDQCECYRCHTRNTVRRPQYDTLFEKAYHCRTCKKTVNTSKGDAAKGASEKDRRAEYDRLQRIQAEKNLAPGFPNARYRAIFGKWPPKEWQENSA